MHGLPKLLRIPRRWLGGVLLIALLGAGCGGREGEVSGTVTYQGKTLPVGNVTFLDANNQSVGSSAITDGKYAISKVRPGPIKILVTTPPPASSNTPKMPKNMMDVKKKMFGTEEPSADATSHRPVSHVTIPAKYGDPNQSDLTYNVQPGAQQHDINLK